MRLYHYVGPKSIAERATSLPAGVVIHSPSDLIKWFKEFKQQPGLDGCVTVTFVIDSAGLLLVADRHSEHVACANRQAVRSAGEIKFRVIDRSVQVVEVSNQSTGYCPEPESWPAVAAAFDSAGIGHPVYFTSVCHFRLCPSCETKNLVKNDVYECGVCMSELPVIYNCQTEGS